MELRDYVEVSEVLTWGSSDSDVHAGADLFDDRPRWFDEGIMQEVLDHKTYDLEDWECYVELEASIRSEGIRVPLEYGVIDGRHVLLNGHHRLAIAVKLGIPTVPVEKSPDREYTGMRLRWQRFAEGQ